MRSLQPLTSVAIIIGQDANVWAVGGTAGVRAHGRWRRVDGDAARPGGMLVRARTRDPATSTAMAHCTFHPRSRSLNSVDPLSPGHVHDHVALAVCTVSPSDKFRPYKRGGGEWPAEMSAKVLSDIRPFAFGDTGA
jgi:hypothetical protein